MNELERFNNFLAGVDLARYRQRYSRIKLVELDMPRDIRPIRHLYREYWERKTDFPSYEDFFDIYSCDLRQKLEEFRCEKMFSKETFYRGIPARIYRTWASLLTQIQGGYAAEHLYGRGSVDMGVELDFRGVDIRVHVEGKDINIQIKKDTMNREVRAPWKETKRDIKIVNMVYEVPGCDPLTKAGEVRVPFKRWQDRWEGKLKRLDNGFIIFTPEMFSLDQINIS